MSSNSTAKKIRYALRWLPDKPYIQLNYFAHFHKFANLKNPITYNEKWKIGKKYVQVVQTKSTAHWERRASWRLCRSTRILCILLPKTLPITS